MLQDGDVGHAALGHAAKVHGGLGRHHQPIMIVFGHLIVRLWRLLQVRKLRRVGGRREVRRLRHNLRSPLLRIVFLTRITVTHVGLHALLFTLPPSGEGHVHVTQSLAHRGHRRNNELDDGGMQFFSRLFSFYPLFTFTPKPDGGRQIELEELAAFAPCIPAFSLRRLPRAAAAEAPRSREMTLTTRRHFRLFPRAILLLSPPRSASRCCGKTIQN